jgi:heme exporter protein A
LIIGKKLAKYIAGKLVLRNLDIHIKEGEFVCCFGPNGAGKTTLLKVLSLLTSFQGGQLFVMGKDVKRNRGNLCRLIGLASHDSYIYGHLTAKENLKFYGMMYDLPDAEKRSVALLQRMGLGYVENEQARTFSRGMIQRLTLARAFLHEPSIIFLDEPFAGLDDSGKEILDQILWDQKTKRKTIVMVTHDREHGLMLCDRALIMSKGAILGISAKETR